MVDVQQIFHLTTNIFQIWLETKENIDEFKGLEFRIQKIRVDSLSAKTHFSFWLFRSVHNFWKNLS